MLITDIFKLVYTVYKCISYPMSVYIYTRLVFIFIFASLININHLNVKKSRFNSLPAKNNCIRLYFLIIIIFLWKFQNKSSSFKDFVCCIIFNKKYLKIFVKFLIKMVYLTGTLNWTI